MNILHVNDELIKLEQHKYDREVAIQLERCLWMDVLGAIASGQAECPRSLASAALNTLNIRIG